MEGKGISFIVLLCIVAILSLSLAALAGYMFFVGGPSKASTDADQPEVTHEPEEDELLTIKLFGEEGKKLFNLKSEDDNKIAILQISAELKCFKQVKGVKSVEEKINANMSEIYDMIGSYFMNMTLKEAVSTEGKEKAKKELVEKINEILSPNDKVKKQIVYKVIFEEWNYQ